MKKALSLMLTMCLVLSLFATFVVSASAEEATNLAAGKEVANQENIDASKTTMWIDTDLTDGVVETGDFTSTIKWTPGQWFGYYSWAEAAETNSVDGVAIPTVDLGAVYSIESARVHVYGGAGWSGIVAPTKVELFVSNDGETWTSAGAIDVVAEETNCSVWLEVKAAAGTTGKFARIAMTHSTEGSWLFIDELEVWGKEAPAAEKVVTWKDGQVKGEDGNWTFDNAYGYTFAINPEDKKIGGEDNALIETVDEYNACNPNWAISVLLKPAGDLYEVVTVVATPGTAAAGIEKGIVIENGNIVLVAHSAYSHEEGANYEGKLCALALKAGDKVKVADDKSSVYVLIPGVDDKETLYVKGENLVAGKEYVISEQFRQGGQEVGWGYDENAPIAYPDEGGTLTDGVVDPGDNSFANAVWAGFSANAPTYKDYGYNFVNIDLGEAKNISEMAIYLGTSALTSGIGVSNSTVQFFASDDGENWEAVSYVIVPVDDASVNYIKVSANVNTNARYVQVRFARAGWLFVSEVEVYEAVLAPEGSVKETITVDGAVTDNGWAADKWITVSGENGSWQYPTKKEVAEGAAIPTFTYDFQLRADDDKLYGAVVLDGVHENEKNIKVRIWFRNDNAATVYSSFYDFVLAPDGTLTTAAKYNTSTTENKGANIENSTLEAVAKVVDGKTVFEFSVDIAEVAADGNFDYFVSLERKQGENNGTLYFPFIPEKDETAPHGNYPWLLWMAENDASVNVEDIALGVIVAEGGETDDNLGDAGIYAIAALAVVALIGTAVVIKKRA